MNNEILTELRKPFHPSQIEWKPGAVNQDQSRALGLAYADVRAYQNRLDEVCGMDWSVSYLPWGDRIICHLTIAGVTRSSTGEAGAQSERNEIAGTAAEAQAFKRACSAFGLGRYLYNLPSIWVEYSRENRYFSEKGKQRLEQIVWQHYRNSMGEASTADAPAMEQNGSGQPSTTQAALAGHRQEAPAGSQQPDVAAALREQFDALGLQLYGAQWPEIRSHNTERISGGRTKDAGELTAEQVQKLIDGLKSLQRKRTKAKSTRG